MTSEDFIFDTTLHRSISHFSLFSRQTMQMKGRFSFLKLCSITSYHRFFHKIYTLKRKRAPKLGKSIKIKDLFIMGSYVIIWASGYGKTENLIKTENFQKTASQTGKHTSKYGQSKMVGHSFFWRRQLEFCLPGAVCPASPI